MYSVILTELGISVFENEKCLKYMEKKEYSKIEDMIGIAKKF